MNMKLVEFRPESQGRPESKVAFDLDSKEYARPEGIVGKIIWNILRFRVDFDGGDLGEPTDPNDYLDYPFDGGII